jgi:hypothetical protein
MSKYGLHCSQVLHSSSKSSSFNKLWLLRVRITKQLLNSGFDVMLSDSDAIWLQNPFSYIEKFSSSGIILFYNFKIFPFFNIFLLLLIYVRSNRVSSFIS